MGIYEKRYQSDYDETEKVDEKGRTYKEVRYVGLHYVSDLTPEQKKSILIRLWILFLIAVVTYVFAVTRNIAGNRSGVTSAAGGFVSIAMIFLAMGLVRWTIHKEPYERIRYERSILYMCYAGAIGAVLGGANVVLQIISMILNKPDKTTAILAIIGYTVNTAVLLVIYRMVKKIHYREAA